MGLKQETVEDTDQEEEVVVVMEPLRAVTQVMLLHILVLPVLSMTGQAPLEEEEDHRVPSGNYLFPLLELKVSFDDSLDVKRNDEPMRVLIRLLIKSFVNSIPEG